MHDDSASAEELAVLQAAVLRDHDQFIRMEPNPRSVRLAHRLRKLHLSWLLIPWYVVSSVRFSSLRRVAANEQEVVRRYRRLSGKDPGVARAEMWRLGHQLKELDERLRNLWEQRPTAPRGADPAELEAAVEALIEYYLAGRRTDDELLDQVERAWAEYEELTEQSFERAVAGRRSRRRSDPDIDEQVRAAAERYRTAWRRWFDRQAEGGSASGGGHPQDPRSVQP